MSTDAVITVEGVSKSFRLHGAGQTLKSAALGLFGPKRKRPVFDALKDVSFTVGSGETLGIIGANGAGKSTLLSLVTGTMQPSTGTISTRGTISSLLELGAGFHPDLTGRENVYLYGAIMGLSRKQMADRFDAIVEFAGLESFIDEPVKHYSSGMYVRLGFAVAVEVNPDILLIDEVLAVGDATFQRKCIQKMEQFRSEGKTMLIISHDLPTIQSISDRILLLDDGQIAGLGDPMAMIHNYESLSRKRNAKALAKEWGTGDVRITDVSLADTSGRPADRFQWGGSLQATVHYKCRTRIERPVFGFAISDESGTLIYGSNTQIEDADIPYVEDEGCLSLSIDKLAMATGSYLLSFSVHSSDHKINYHRLDNTFPFAVESTKEFEGCCYMPCTWRVGE